MTPNWQTLKLLLPAILGLAFCCQCQTTDEPDVVTSLEGGSKFGKLGKVSKVGIKRESGYKLAGVNDNELESSGNKSEGADRISSTLKNEKVIKNSQGEVVRTETRKDLYADQTSTTARETGKAFNGTKEARIKTNKYAEKEFKTPEYLQRQEFAGTKTFKDGSLAARESGSESKSFADKFFKTSNSSLDNQVARENGSTSNRFGKTYKTSSDRASSKALASPATPVGVQGMRGYRDNVELSMDDVKKLVNPSAVH